MLGDGAEGKETNAHWGDCNKEGFPETGLPDASLTFTALMEQMGLTNESSKHQVKGIYQSDPSNYCKWSVLSSSQVLKDKFERREVNLSQTDKTNNQTYSYNLRTNSAPRNLLVTIQSIPHIDDDELRDSFRKWRVVKTISQRGYAFAPHIDSGLQRVFIHLHEGVRPEDAPWYITFSDG